MSLIFRRQSLIATSFRFLAICLSFGLFAPTSLAQAVPAENSVAAETLKGVWIVQIDNEPRTRTLVVGNKVSLENGETIVDGQWGFSDGGLVKSKVTVSVKGGKTQAKVETASPTSLDFELVTSKAFEGRWLNRSGKIQIAMGKKFEPAALAQAGTVVELPAKPVAFELKDGSAFLPDLKVGDTWRYVETDQRTNVKTRDREVRLVSFADGQWTGTDSGGVYKILPNLSLVESSTSRTETGERTDFVFPLKTGTKWSQKYGWTNLVTNAKGGAEAEVRVLAYEKIKTPVGEFDSFKVEVKGFWKNTTQGNSGRFTETHWYAPAVRNVVQREYDDGFTSVRSVLTGFNLNQ